MKLAQDTGESLEDVTQPRTHDLMTPNTATKRVLPMSEVATTAASSSGTPFSYDPIFIVNLSSGQYHDPSIR